MYENITFHFISGFVDRGFINNIQRCYQMMTVVSQTVSFFKVLFVHYLNDMDVDMDIL